MSKQRRDPYLASDDDVLAFMQAMEDLSRMGFSREQITQKIGMKKPAYLERAFNGTARPSPRTVRAVVSLAEEARLRVWNGEADAPTRAVYVALARARVSLTQAAQALAEAEGAATGLMRPGIRSVREAVESVISDLS
jgi:hypothetical protein